MRRLYVVLRMPPISKVATLVSMNEDLSLNQAVADVLRGELASRRWTLEDLSAASGIPKVSVQRYVAGSRNIDVAILEALSRALEVSAADVMAAAVERMKRTASPPRHKVDEEPPDVSDAG